MKALTRDEILGADDLKTESVKVPEWGGTVLVRELTGAERDEWEASVVKTNGTTTLTFTCENDTEISHI